MSNLFRSGTAFFIVAGISFLAAAITTVRYFMTEDGSVAPTGGVVANGVVMMIVGMAIKKKNAQRANRGAPAAAIKP